MKKFKVEFSGFVYVLANDKDEALDKYSNGEIVYEEKDIDNAFEVEDFEIDISE